MKTSEAGRKLIERFEGLRLEAYRDAIGVLTIGYGHTTSAGAPRVYAGLKLTQEEADTILSNDLQAVENVVNRLVKVPLTQNQFDALVSLTFNIGGGNLSKSTLLRYLNQKDYRGAALSFKRFNRAAGKTLSALTVRRKAEEILFLRQN